MKILIAEDDAVSRLILRRAVEKFGHECLAAEDGEQAWEMYLQNAGDTDVVISNWMMPNLDGPGLCRRIRGHAEPGGAGYAFFIFLTALGDKEHLFEGMRVGADDFLKKPLDREELGVRLMAAERVTSLHRRLSEQKRKLERLNRDLFTQSRCDPLTGLGNRLRLKEDLETARAQVERYGHAYCAILCDVDNFKAYNDTYGHVKGDEALKKVADIMRRCFRATDVCYRYGGDEFLILLPEQTPRAALMAVERLRRAVEDFAIPHRTAPAGVLTVSCGLAELPAGSDKSSGQLIKEADQALYEAKKRGKNSTAVFEGE